MEQVLAAVRTGPSKTEIREFPMPDIPPDGALMKMEVAGICGTDVKLYKTPPSNEPVIMGHENIGYIAKAGREFTQRKGFKEGDLVLSSTTFPAANASGATRASTGIARIRTGATTPMRSATVIRRRPRRRIYGAALRNMFTCRGMPSCIMCRRV